MNQKVLEIFEDYYKGVTVDTIRRSHHKSEKTIRGYIEKYNFDQMAADRSNAIMSATTNELQAARLDVIKAVRNSFSHKPTQKNVFGDDVITAIPLDTSRDLENMAKIITALDGSSFTPGTVVNVNEKAQSVDIGDDVLREIGRKLATEAANE